MKKEIWKPIPGMTNYKVSNLGRVQGPYKILTPHLTRDGYQRVQVYAKKKSKNCPVHRLVLLAFVGPCPKGHQTAHLDGVRTNNRLSNLKWVTPKENTRHKFIHGTILMGEKTVLAKLSDKEVKAIRRIIWLNMDTKGIAKRFNVSRELIYKIVTRQLWKHI